MKFLAALTLISLLFGRYAETEPLWRVADEFRSLSFAAQTELLRRTDDPLESMLRMREIYTTTFQPEIAALRPEINAAVLAELDRAEQAIADGDGAALAMARGQVWTHLLAGSYAVTLDALAQGDIEKAQRWLRIREFRQATRVSVVQDKAGEALDAVLAGEIDLAEAEKIVGEDLRDAYFFRFRQAFNELQAAAEKDFPVRAAEWAGQADGYFVILADDFVAKQGSEAADAVAENLTLLENATLAGDWAAVNAIIAIVRDQISNYLPIELDEAELAARGRTLHTFIDLIYIEYKDAVRDGVLTAPIEYQEAMTFLQQARATYEELRPVIANPPDAARLAAILDEIEATMLVYGERETVKTLVSEALYLVESNLETQAKSDDAMAAFDTLDELLDDLERAVRQGRYPDAERLRIEAYAVFDTGPELRLIATEPRLIANIEALFWQGDSEHIGLAQGIARKVSYQEIVKTRAELDKALALAQLKLADRPSASFAVILNTAVIVFREGLEAVVILVALMASMASAKQRGYRKPVVLGALGAFAASGLTFLVATFFLSSLSRYGEKLEAVVSLIAIGVLLLITNWFFHKSYWTDWMARFHRAKNDAIRGEQGQMIGLMLVGFTSIYREGFETVLFLQALVLDAGVGVVLQGVVLGLVLVLGVGYIAFKLQTRLPYKKLLIVTGVLIVSVLFTMVGHTLHLMQAVGWLPITPIHDLYLPYWAGLWLGIYPTMQTLFGQILAVAFVVGSYGAAEVWRARKRHARQTVRAAS